MIMYLLLRKKSLIQSLLCIVQCFLLPAFDSPMINIVLIRKNLNDTWTITKLRKVKHKKKKLDENKWNLIKELIITSTAQRRQIARVFWLISLLEWPPLRDLLFYAKYNYWIVFTRKHLVFLLAQKNWLPQNCSFSIIKADWHSTRHI